MCSPDGLFVNDCSWAAQRRSQDPEFLSSAPCILRILRASTGINFPLPRGHPLNANVTNKAWLLYRKLCALAVARHR